MRKVGKIILVALICVATTLIGICRLLHCLEEKKYLYDDDFDDYNDDIYDYINAWRESL